MRKINCWEYKQCGRQQGGHKAIEFGACNVSLETKYNKVNGGVNGGRYCWHVDDSLCGYENSGNFAQQHDICQNCDFRKLVEQEENTCFIK